MVLETAGTLGAGASICHSTEREKKKIMMESTEEHPCGSLDPGDSSFNSEEVEVANTEDCAREVMPINQNNQVNDVLGYLDKENATLVLESENMELNKKRLLFTQGPEDEVLVYVGSEQDSTIEHTLPQSFSENSINLHTLAMQCGLNNLRVVTNDPIERNENLQNMDNVKSNGNHYLSKPLGYQIQEEDDTTEMVFIPTASQVISLSNNTGFLHLSGVVHPTAVASKLYKNGKNGCANKLSEESVTVSQTHADSYSSKMEDGVSAVNKEDNNNTHEEHMVFEVETSSPAVERASSMLSIPPQDFDHAVSVTHATTSTLYEDWRTKNIQEDKRQADDIIQSDITLPVASTNVTYLECSNFKKSLESELFSENSLVEELSNNSDLKDGTYSSNKNDDENCETCAIVEERVDEDANESINSQLLSTENFNDNSKQKDSINCKNIDSNASVDFGQSLENKFFYPSSKNCENEMDFTNFDEACSEIQACTEKPFLSIMDDSDSKGSFFSTDNQSKDDLHISKMIKSVSPSKIKNIDVYDFEDSSISLDQELSHNSSLDWRPSDISIEVDATRVNQSMNSSLKVKTGNLTFKGILTPVTNDPKLSEDLNEEAEQKRDEIYYNNSQYLIDQGPHKDMHSSSEMLSSTNGIICKNKQNSIISQVNHTYENKKSDENILAEKNDVNIDKRSENESLILNIAAAYETIVESSQRTCSSKKKTSDSCRNIELISDDFSDSESYPSQMIFCLDDLADEVNLMPSYLKNNKVKGTSPVDEATKVLTPEAPNFDNKSKENDSIFSNIAISDEITVRPPQRTYGRKKKTVYSDRNIELFSDFFDSEPYQTSKFFSLDIEEEKINDEDNLTDEDGYINLMPSSIKNRKTYTVDESVISLKPESSDPNILKNMPDFDIDDEDSLDDFQFEAYFIEKLFKPTYTKTKELNAPKASSPDVPKAASPRSSLKNRVQTPSYEKTSAKIDNYKSGQLWDTLIKSSPFEMKNDKKSSDKKSSDKKSSDKKKIKKKVQNKKEKTLKRSKSFNRPSISMVHHKKGHSSKDSERSGSIIHSFSSLKKVNDFGIKFVKSNSTENNFAMDDLSSSSTSTEEFINLQYTCSKCNFGTNKLNNLISHLKYFKFKCLDNVKNKKGSGKKKNQKKHGKLSGKFSSASVIDHQYTASLSSTSKVLRKASDKALSRSTKPVNHQ